MTEDNADVEMTDIESKFTRIALTIISVFLIFIGPTYIPYLFFNVMGIEYFVSIGLGALFFVVGLILLIYLIRKKVIS